MDQATGSGEPRAAGGSGGPDEPAAGQAGGPSMPDDQAAALPAAPPTGDQRVDHALAPLAGLAGLPVTEHPQVFEHLHGRLVEVLGELGPGTGQAG